jgi:hypothetical protein
MLALAARLAWAEPPVPLTSEAQAHLQRGLRLYDTQSYEQAIAEFRAGYQLVPHPDFLYALAQAERMRGNCKHAIDAYRAYLRTRPPEKGARLARSNIARCEAALEAASELAPPPSAPPPRPIPPPRTEELPWYSDHVGNAVAGAAVVTFGVGATLLVLGSRHATAANEGATFEEYEAEAETSRRHRIIGGITVGVGAGLMVGALLRYRLHERPRRPVDIQVAPGPEGAVIGLCGSF